MIRFSRPNPGPSGQGLSRAANLSRALLASITLAVALSACGSYHQETTSIRGAVPSETVLTGKTVGVLPAVVTFGASTLALDLRDATITINGQSFKLQDRYIKYSDLPGFGRVGYLDTDILSRANVDPKALARSLDPAIVAMLKRDSDYNIGFFNGFGQDNFGQLSSRPMLWDMKTWPYVLSYEQVKDPSFYRDVVALTSDTDPQRSKVDLLLSCDVSLSSEVFECLVQPNSADFNKGDYVLAFLGSIRWKLVDAATGAVVVDQKEKLPYEIGGGTLSKDIKMAVNKGDAAAYAKYFRTVDLLPFARDAVNSLLSTMYPHLNPYYVNTTRVVEDKK